MTEKLAQPAVKEAPALNVPDEKAFNTRLDSFKAHTSASMDDALALSHMAIMQFAKHGNLSYAQRFLDAMPLNFSRKGAFVEWLKDHSPLRVEGQLKTGYTLLKDKSPDANAFRVEVALIVPFWEYLPEKEQINFDEKDIIKAIKTTINKFRGNRYHANTDRALFALAQADMVCRLMEVSVSTGKPITVTETANDAKAEASKAA